MKRRILKFLVISLFFSLSISAAGGSGDKSAKVDTKYGSDLPMLKNSLIAIDLYDPETRTYQIHSVTFPGEGFSYVTPEALAKGITAIELDSILLKPSSVVGNQYQTDAKIPTLFPQEKEARKKR